MATKIFASKSKKKSQKSISPNVFRSFYTPSPNFKAGYIS